MPRLFIFLSKEPPKFFPECTRNARRDFKADVEACQIGGWVIKNKKELKPATMFKMRAGLKPAPTSRNAQGRHKGLLFILFSFPSPDYRLTKIMGNYRLGIQEDS
jgi:hypothetical protein